LEKEVPATLELKETSEICITVDLPNEAFLKSWQDLHESVKSFKSTLDDRSRTNINVQAGLSLIQANYKAVFESDISSNYDVVEIKTTFDALNQAIQEVIKKTGRPSSSLIPITRQGPFNPWLPSNSLCKRLIDLTASAPQKKANLPKPPATEKDAEPAVTYPPIELDPCTIS
jgi:hypothetical protein